MKQRQRVPFLVGAAVIALAALAALTTTHQPQASAAGEPLLFGAHTAMRNAATESDAFARLERGTGRTLAAARIYGLWDEPFPDRYEQWLSDGGRTLVYSVKARRVNGTDVPWARIAAAAPGTTLHSEMKRLGDQLRTFEHPIYVILHHEPEAGVNTAYGTSDDFVAAWRKFVGVIRGQGAGNVKFLLALTDYSFSLPGSDRRAATKWYPGDDVVDAIGADAYNWFRCRGRDEGWKSLEEIIEPFRRFGDTHPGKELWLPEYGSVEDPADPGRKARWFLDAAALFAKPGWSQFRGVLYFHDEDATHPRCDWWVDSSPAASNGFAQMGDAPILGGTGGVEPCSGGLVRCAARATVGAIRERRP